MKLPKSEIAPKLAKLRAAVPYSKQHDIFPAGVIIKDNTITIVNETLQATCTILDKTDEDVRLDDRSIELIQNLPAGAEIDIEVREAGAVHIRSGKTWLNQSPLEASNIVYQKPPQAAPGTWSFDAALLRQAMKDVLYAVSKSDTKPAHCGIRFDADDGVLNLVALDGFRSAWDAIPCGNTFGFTLPNDAVSAVLSLIDGADTVSIQADARTAFFTMGEYTLLTRLQTGEFLNYRKVYPQPGDQWVKIDRKKFLEAVRRCTIVTPLVSMRLNVKKAGEIEITSGSSTASFSETVEAETKGLDGFKIAFNQNYITDAIKNMRGDKAVLYFTSNLSPVLFKGDKDEQTLKQSALVLPVREKNI